MSNNKKETEQKVMTKYDQKMQKRQDEKAQAAKKDKREKWIGIIGVLIIVCVLLAFPITSYIAANSTYFTIGDEKITRVEFDYAYKKELSNFLASDEYAEWEFYGYDLTGDLSKEYLNDYITWQDAFEEKAVIALSEKHALLEMAEKEGFTFDTEPNYQSYLTTMNLAASSANMTLGKYLRYAYGGYANEKRLEQFVREDIFTQEYYNHLLDISVPTDEAINTYYENNKMYLDLVDYRIMSVKAEVEEGATADKIGDAMTAAKKMAESFLETIMEESDVYVDQKMTDMDTKIADWLFSADRKQGDTTVIVDDTTRQAHAICFENRHKDERETIDYRMMVVGIEEGEDLFNQWKAGDATEETFAEMCKEHSWDNLASEGGLVRGVAAGTYKGEVDKWLYEEERNIGDATFIEDAEQEVTYLLYYLNEARPAWQNTIIDIMAADVAYEQFHSIAENYAIRDPKNNLNYIEAVAAELEAYEKEQADAETAETDSTEETTE